MKDGVHVDTVPGRLRARAEEHPDAVALEVVGGGRLTYVEWDRRSAEVASGLRDLGVRPGDRVVLPCDSDTTIEYAVAYVGVQSCGGVAVPVLERLGSPHLVSVLSQTRAVGVIGDAPVADVWCRTVASLGRDQPAQDLGVAVGPLDPAEILFTSGTTGRPKGVVANHRNLLFTHAGAPRRPRVVLHAIPPGTNAGQGLMLLALHPSPHRVITLSRFQPRDLLQAIETDRPDDVVIVPAHALAILQREDCARYDLSSVSLVRSVSDAITPTTLAALDRTFATATVVSMYTTTEAWPARVRIAFDPNRPTAVGLPEGASAVRVLADGLDVAPGVHGEVWLRAKGAPQRSYYDDPEASRAVFRDGWVRTGDIGWVDTDGYLYLVDRSPDLVITGGVNLSSLEVEQAAMEFPGVTGVAAFGVPHPTLGQVLALAVTGEVDADVLEDYLDERLGAVKAPKRVIVVPTIPRSEVGKALKHELRAHYAALLQTGHDETEDAELVDDIRALWSKELGLHVPDDRSFLDLGGTSFDAMAIVAGVIERFRCDIRPRALYRAPTVRAFARAVADAPQLAESSFAAIPRVPRMSGHAPSAPEAITLPASYIQREWWHSVDEATSNDNVMIALSLAGALDTGALREAIGHLVARHETLRTYLVRTNAGVYQKIGQASGLPLEEVRLTRRPTADEQLYQLLHAQLHEPFVLTDCPLWRGLLVRVSRERHVLALTLHHVISDRWSGGVIRRDLARLYEDALHRRKPSVEELAIQFADFAAWEQEQRDPALERRWRERLTPLPSYPRLPASGNWRPGAPFTVAAHPYPPISAQDTRALRRLAEAHRLTLGVALHAAAAATLSPYVDHELTVGVLYAIRQRRELQPIIGPLIDHLPLRVQIGRNGTFLDIMRQVGAEWDSVFSERLPLGRITLAALGNGTPRPLFDVVVNYLPYAREHVIEAAGPHGALTFAFYNERNSDTQHIRVDREISLAVRLGHMVRGNATGALEGSLFINADALGWERVSALGQAFSNGLVALARDPEKPVRDLLRDSQAAGP